ncbi:MAG: DUF6580 family putative transport protein [Candidatus Paceibacterota bacterium]
MALTWKQLLFILIALVCFGFLMRLIPHPPNATPITALALVGSLYLGRKYALFLPLIALALSDFFIGFYDWKVMVSVYFSFALIALFSWVLKKYRTFLPIATTIIASSLFFFFVTNTAVWLFSPWYEKTLTGLLYSLELGIPFLRNMLMGDLVYTFGLIAVFETARAFAQVKIASLMCMPFSHK